MSNIWFLIPARSGSKGIPKKNVRLLNGKPLICHVLDTLLEIADKEHVIVSTDGEEIKSLTEGKASIHDRSAVNANDEATLDDVAKEVTQHLLESGKASQKDVLIT